MDSASALVMLLLAAAAANFAFGTSPRAEEAKALEDGCDCDELEVVTTNDAVLIKHGQLLGRYSLRRGLTMNGRPTYEHHTGKFFLYHNDESQGFWAIGERLGSEVVRLENQGDRMCPYYLKSMWRYADGDVNALVYDVSMRVACMSDPCSVAQCGHQAFCRVVTKPPTTTIAVADLSSILRNLDRHNDNQTTTTSTATTTTTQRPQATCDCKPGFVGNPYERCFPANVTNGCGCERLVFSSRNELATAKHENSYGEYFLFDVRDEDGRPVYQHFSGIEYLYERDGHWLVSDKIGIHEAGLQNQGEDHEVCPYRFRTSWEYADVERAGWQWIYDHSARLICPNDPCSAMKCGFRATCTAAGDQGICTCDVGYSGNAYERCFPAKPPGGCRCRQLSLSSAGPSALAQSDKMGSYFLYGYHNQRPAYQHESGLDYLFYAEGKAWVIGAKFGGARVGIVNFDPTNCPHRSTSPWRHSVGGKLQKDQRIRLVCAEPRPLSTVAATNRNGTFAILDVAQPLAPPAFSASDQAQKIKAQLAAAAGTTTTQSGNQRLDDNRIDDERQRPSLGRPPTTACDCPRIVVTSRNPNTLQKHANQLGGYVLHTVSADGGRPVYKHDTNDQYLYYHPFSGGNWLINSQVGLLHGGIQNSKDFPLCPYNIKAVWQYGDAELGGWTYDPTLSVTCPTDPCSVLKCGFRAQCVYNDDDDQAARCVCLPGHSGNPSERCYPAPTLPCPCLKLRLTTTGAAKLHQADKMGDYHLWGSYNNRTVYQHDSGLDFLYYHENDVWGVGPRIGGNSAGLLNFGRQPCPYQLETPWEFGTRFKSAKKRRIDRRLVVRCVDTSNPFQTKFDDDQPEEEKPSSPSCGKVLSSTSDDVRAHHPWHAVVTVLGPTASSSTRLCSGAVVGHKHVLTLASCLMEHPMSKYRMTVGQQTFSIQSIFTHDLNDVALVKLKRNKGKHIRFGELAQPACLEKENGIQGWGKCSYPSGQLVRHLTTLSSASSCQSHQVCVDGGDGEEKVEKGMPLVCQKAWILNKGVLLGLFPYQTSSSNETLHFLKVEPYLEWISARLRL